MRMYASRRYQDSHSTITLTPPALNTVVARRLVDAAGTSGRDSGSIVWMSVQLGAGETRRTGRYVAV
jgi:hypothetical protein